MSGSDKSTEQPITNFKATFSTIDKDGDGKVSRDDMAAFLSSLERHPSEQDLARIISEADKDGDGMIDYSEFLSLMVNQLRFGDLMGEVKMIFDRLDGDGDGFITAAELRRMMPMINENVSPDEVEEMIRVADANGDGKVSYEEFVALIMK